MFIFKALILWEIYFYIFGFLSSKLLFEKRQEKTLTKPGIIQSSGELSGIEPGTFRSSVWRSPNWAISAIAY